MSIYVENVKGALKTGELMTAYNTRGKLIEFKLREHSNKYIGTTRVSHTGEVFSIIGNLDIKDKFYHYPLYLIKFIDSIYLVVNIAGINKNNIKSPNTPSIFGIGFLGQGTFNKKANIKEYRTWRSMFVRCYSEAFLKNSPAYKGCSVDPRWYNFQNFCEDIVNLEGYREWKANTEKFAYALDKDIKIEGNKVYSKDTCIFTTLANNNEKAHITGKTYLATLIDTGYTEEFDNISKFAKTQSLKRRELGTCLKSNYRILEGWSFKVLETK